MSFYNQWRFDKVASQWTQKVKSKKRRKAFITVFVVSQWMKVQRILSFVRLINFYFLRLICNSDMYCCPQRVSWQNYKWAWWENINLLLWSPMNAEKYVQIFEYFDWVDWLKITWNFLMCILFRLPLHKGNIKRQWWIIVKEMLM